MVTIRHRLLYPLRVVLLMLTCSIARAGSPMFSLGLELVSVIPGDGVDAGYSLQIGYEMPHDNGWSSGLQLELMNGWNESNGLLDLADLSYQSKSLFLSARPSTWPVKFKLGLVKADYDLLLQPDGTEIRSEDKSGTALGVALGYGGEQAFVELVDVKRIRIGSDDFYSIFLSVFLVLF